MLRTVLKRLTRLLAGVSEHPGTVPADAITDLTARIEALESAEALRAAEHGTALDRIERLYKRLSARIARDMGQTSPDERNSIVGHPGSTESPLTLRRRLNR